MIHAVIALHRNNFEREEIIQIKALLVTEGLCTWTQLLEPSQISGMYKITSVFPNKMFFNL